MDCQEAPDFEARRRLWLTPENHHYARLTRILRSLVLLGFAEHAEALVDFLYLLHRRYPAFIAANTWNHWRETVEFHEWRAALSNRTVADDPGRGMGLAQGPVIPRWPF